MILALMGAAAACSPEVPARVAPKADPSRRTAGAIASEPPGAGVQPSTPSDGIVVNAGGSLAGSVLGPSAAIISNNGAGLIGNNGANFQLHGAGDPLAPVAGARVELVDGQGRAVSEAPITTDAQGAYLFDQLKPSGPVVFVRVRYRLADREVSMAGVTRAPGASAQAAPPVTPASTLIAAKVGLALGAGQLREGEVDAQALAAAAGELQAAMSDRAIAEALLQPPREVVQVLDRILDARPDLAQAVGALAGPVVAPVAVASGPAPSPGPSVPSPPGASAPPSATPSSAVAPSSAPSATPTPWPEDAYQVRRVAGSAQGGMVSGGSRLSDTFMRLSGLVLTPADAFIVADTGANQIRRLPASGSGTLIAGRADGTAGFDPEPIATESRLDQPHGLAYDAVEGNVYFCDTGNHRVRKLAGGILSTVAGGGTDAADAVPVGTNAQLSSPFGLARDDDGALLFTERTTARVRRLGPDGRLSTLATGVGSGPLALDRENAVVWVAKGGVVTAIGGIHGSTPTVAAPSVFVARQGAASPEVTGLAYDGAGGLYVAQASFPSGGAPVDARLFRVPVDGSGRATGTPVVIAGTGGQSGDAAAYSPSTADTNGLTVLLSNDNWCALTFAPDGNLYAGNAYPGQWGQILRLSGGP